MAAKLHIQQVHNGDGSIEAGAGPGVESVAPPSAPPAGPPTAPTAREDIDERRRERPTPRPLHQSNFEVPQSAMDALLEVWDTIGTKRGVEGFVHSSMVMKVYAAKPSIPESTFTNMVARPEGENPLSQYIKGAGKKEWARGVPGKQCFPVPFKLAIGDRVLDCEGGWASNPYIQRSLMPKREPVKPVKQDDPTEAPVTPYGQLPKFGQSPQVSHPNPAASPNSPAAAAQAASPFAAAAQGASPFAAAAQAASPFAAAAQAASPFAAAAQAASPFAAAAQAASPFAAAAQAASPFAAAAQLASPTSGAGQNSTGSPFTAPASPFGAPAQASPFASSPAPSPFASPFGAVGTPAFPPFPAFDGFAMGMGFGSGLGSSVPVVEDAKRFTCSICGKAFSTEYGLAHHNKDRHNIDMPVVIKEHKRKEKVPDLPAYVPSPVDLSSTSPFGNEPSGASQRWSDIELIPHALSVNNITLVGAVEDVSTSSAGGYFTVRVASEDGPEDFVVHCSREKMTVTKGMSVCVVGSLKLHPTLDEGSNKYYSVPIVHVSGANGVVAEV